MTLSAKDKLEAFERWSGRATAVILFGVVVEIVPLWLSPHPRPDRILGTTGNLIVALGLAIEYVFILLAITATRQANRESEAEVAAANERAAAAEQKAAEAYQRAAEIERLTAWRRLSPAQHVRLVEAFRRIAASLDVLIESQYGDPEAYTYGSDIVRALRESGVSAIRRGQNSLLGQAVFGLLFSVEANSNLGIGEIFSEAGLAARVDGTPPPSSFVFGDAPKPSLYIFVAPNPPPDIMDDGQPT